jgi:large subunit ribosomal protein L24
MIESSQPRKERKYRFTAPMHARQKFVHAHVSKELATKLGIKSRSISMRKGDTVKVFAGTQKGKTGKVSSINLKTGRVVVDGITRKNAKGKELPVAIYSSNLYLVDIDTSDKLRNSKIESLKNQKPVA